MHAWYKVTDNYKVTRMHVHVGIMRTTPNLVDQGWNGIGCGC